MATYAYGAAAAQYHSRTPSQQHSQHNNNNNHHNRSRRGPRIASQNAHRHYKAAQRSTKEVVADTRACSEYLQRLEAARSFEFDDDEVFCPFHLLTEDDLQSIHSSSSSDRGSLSSDSPEGSPLQQQVQPTPSFLLSTATSSTPAYYHHQQQHQHQQHQHQQHNNVKLHQPMAQRTRNAIPIVDPSTRSVASPPLSISPARAMQQQYQVPRRW